MNITLRKANILQKSISDAIKSIEINSSVSITEFHDALQEISVAKITFDINLARRANLNRALYNIRREVGKANASSGIDDRLTEVAFLDREISFYSDILVSKVRLPDAVINGKLDKIRSSTNERDSLYREDQVSTGIFLQNDLDNFRNIIASLRKQKQKLQDEILESNVKTEIALSEDDRLVLEKESLI